MSILTALYHLLIGPLELLFEVIFALANRVVRNPGLAIIFLSLAVNFLVLPLYKQADAMQEESRDTEQRLSHWVKHIKKTFSGDERFMILQTYYRQNNYKPTDALKGSMSLLLEIPFFMAAYNFLSELQLLNGVSFGPVHDLGSPDGLLVIAGVTINVLPVLMTVINLVSGAIYTKGFPAKAKVQLYGMALIFLVLLYDSPSGLVFYWTLNNLFSLGKNIFYKLKNPKRVLCGLCSAVGIAGLAFLLLHPMAGTRKQLMAIAAMLAMQLPTAGLLVSKRIPAGRAVQVTGGDRLLFHLGCVFLALLTGLMIPTTLVHSAPEEFINLATFHNPLLYVLNASLLAWGMFVVWFGIFYMLANPTGKKLMGLGVWALSIMAVVNYMFFGTDFGSLSATLKYDFYPRFTMKLSLINLAVLAVAVGAGYLVWRWKKPLVRFAYITVGLAMVGMSVIHTVGIQAVVPDTIEKLRANAEQVPSISLSREGKNVVVIMMDRAVGSYIPYIFNEKPEVARQFAGFTYYPNTLAHGGHTNFGSPGFYGGYEYTPASMNKRDDMPLMDKHNEALKVMPVIFDREGYEVTVTDPAYANYRWIPDLSIYDEYPQIHTYNIMGRYDAYSQETSAAAEQMSMRNFFCFSIFKTSPMILQPTLYTQGTYNHPDSVYQMALNEQIQSGTSTAKGMVGKFVRAYSTLEHLPGLTQVSDSGKNTFLMMTNDTTHEPMMLKEPEYVPEPVVDNTEYDALHGDRFDLDGRVLKMNTTGQVMHYHINMAAMIQLGQWLDHLRQIGVYDNTRIIIGADHGYYLGQRDDMFYDGIDLMAYNPLLMVKDFNSSEFTVDDRFMTNADVPTLATAGVVENPVNPFTGNPIPSEDKTESVQYVTMSREFNTAINNGTAFLPGQWLSVKDNIFDMNNWSHAEQP